MSRHTDTLATFTAQLSDDCHTEHVPAGWSRTPPVLPLSASQWLPPIPSVRKVHCPKPSAALSPQRARGVCSERERDRREREAGRVGPTAAPSWCQHRPSPRPEHRGRCRVERSWERSASPNRQLAAYMVAQRLFFIATPRITKLPLVRPLVRGVLEVCQKELAALHLVHSPNDRIRTPCSR